MKILFIYKNLYIYEFKAFPQLATILKKEGHEVKLAIAEKEDVMSLIKEWKPDIVGYSVTTGFHKYYIDLNKKIKKQFNIYSIFGGSHATYFPEIIHEDGIDAVCIGEGENAIINFVNAFHTKRLKYTKNWWIKENNKIYKNKISNLIKDLDTIPFWDREMLYSKDKFLRNNPLKTFLTSRGCLNKCSFCHNIAYLNLYKGKGNFVRLRSVNNLIEEIKSVKENYPLGLVRFDDDFFAFNLNWLRKFSKKYKKEINLPFHCGIVVGLINEERVKLLKEAGCVSLQLGLETGKEEYRKKIINKPYTNKQYIEACKLLKKHKILVILNNIIGLPGETLNDTFKTLELNQICQPAYSWCTLYQPYPKTPLADYAVKNNFFDGHYNNLDYSYYKNSVLKFKNKKEKRQIENLQKLFAITTGFPRLTPIIKQLIKLPPNPIFNLTYKLWYGYTHRYIFPQKMSFQHKLKSIKRFFNKDKA